MDKIGDQEETREIVAHIQVSKICMTTHNFSGYLLRQTETKTETKPLKQQKRT
jgi:hypothetical protein